MDQVGNNVNILRGILPYDTKDEFTEELKKSVSAEIKPVCEKMDKMEKNIVDLGVEVEKSKAFMLNEYKNQVKCRKRFIFEGMSDKVESS